jgi:hypothetical protein
MMVETKAVTIAVKMAIKIVPIGEKSQDSFLRPKLVGIFDLPTRLSAASSPAETFSYN